MYDINNIDFDNPKVIISNTNSVDIINKLKSALNKANSTDKYILYKKLAEIYFELGNYKEVLHYANLILLNDRENSDAYFMKAESYYFTDNYEKALINYQKSYDSGNENEYISAQIALCHHILGNSSKALKYVNMTILKNPEYSFGYYIKALYFVEKQMFEDAIENSIKAIELDENPTAGFYKILAQCQINIFDFDAALMNIKNGLKIDNLDGDLYFLKAMVLFEIGQHAEAHKALLKSQTLGTNFVYS